jgi:hypothetical protein
VWLTMMIIDVGNVVGFLGVTVNVAVIRIPVGQRR